MTIATVYSRAALSIHAPLVTIETHISNGLPSLSIVGLPETVVKESKDRVRSALLNAQFEFPAKKITINLAPADVPKGGARFDLPIAIGILAASKQIPSVRLHDHEFVGELALSGALREVVGILPTALKTRQAQRHLILPQANADEASLCDGLTVFPAANLLDVCAHLSNKTAIPEYIPPKHESQHNTGLIDFADVKGQPHAKRALEIAAAGGHNVLMSGPPGTGKTLLASRFPTILPPLSTDEALEVAAISSLAQKSTHSIALKERPFRQPHHTASGVALVGGGTTPRPGEISLAHHGVMFLDELPEFNRSVLEVLREPLESGKITISRANQQVEFPASFQLIAAMNPCPCGYYGDKLTPCQCSSQQVTRYQQRLSGPLLDRFDLHITIPRPSHRQLAGLDKTKEESSETVRHRVMKARQSQLARANQINAKLSVKNIEKYIRIGHANQIYLINTLEALGCSARAFHRILKVSRTIADLENMETVEQHHIQEALMYRFKRVA